MCTDSMKKLIILLVVLQLNGGSKSDELEPHFFYKNNNHNEGDILSEASDQDNEAHTNVHLLRDQNAFTGTDQKPLEYYIELSNVTDISEFIERFVDKESIDPQWGISENLKRSVERASAISAKPAICEPEKTIVPLLPLTTIEDHDIILFPSCTRVKRCGGCCNHASLSCQPTETTVNNYRVMKFNSKTNRLVGPEIIPIEEHTRCVCNCTLKESDCNAYQTYDFSRCLCLCTNTDARNKCSTQDHKIWDEHSCRCVCRENISCSTNTYFDQNSCTCIKEDDGSPAIPPVIADRKRFFIKATVVETDNSTLYDTI